MAEYYAIRFTFINSPSLWNKKIPKDRIGYAIGGNSIFDNSADQPAKAIKFYNLKQAKAKFTYFKYQAESNMKTRHVLGVLHIDLVPVSFVFGNPING